MELLLIVFFLLCLVVLVLRGPRPPYAPW